MNCGLQELDIDGFGPLTSLIFSGAGFVTADDIMSSQQNECIERLAASIKRLRTKSKVKDDAYWAEIAKKCSNIVGKLRIAQLTPDIPSWCRCPITGEVMSDPVVTPKGMSYERSAIVESIKQKSIDPMYGSPLHMDQLTPNLQLLEAIQNVIVSQNIRFKDDDLEL